MAVPCKIASCNQMFMTKNGFPYKSQMRTAMHMLIFALALGKGDACVACMTLIQLSIALSLQAYPN